MSLNRPSPVPTLRSMSGLAGAVVLLTAAPEWHAPAKAEPPTKPWVPIATLDTQVVREPSGIVKSRRHPGIYWTHGDSGTSPQIFAFRDTGELVATVQISGAPNSDWEDIAIDDEDNLYIGDIGNNRQIFPARFIYVLPEPDPTADHSKPVPWSRRWKFKYPRERFNAESLYVRDGQMHILNVGEKGKPTIYRLAPIAEDECELETVAPLPVWLAQGADVSPDGRWLVVCTGAAAWLAELDDEGRPRKDRKLLQIRYPQCSAEACCFDGDDILILTEEGNLYRIPRKDFEDGVRFVQPPADKQKPPAPTPPAPKPEQPPTTSEGHRPHD